MDGFPWLPQAVRLAQASIDACQDRLGELAESEREEASRFEAPRRQAEWVAGRVVARRALADLLGELPNTLRIVRADDGAAEIAGYEPQPKLSLSHGRNDVVAAAGFLSRLGVDLCEYANGPRVRRVAERFLAASERELVVREAGDDPAAWATLWAIKEAAAKALRHGLFDGGLGASLVVSLEPPRYARPDLDVVVERQGASVVAIAWSQ